MSCSYSLPILFELVVLVHVVYLFSGSFASRNLTGWEWSGIPLVLEFGLFFLPMSPKKILILGMGPAGEAFLFCYCPCVDISRAMRVRRCKEDSSLALIYFAPSLVLFTSTNSYHRPANLRKRALCATYPHIQPRHTTGYN